MSRFSHSTIENYWPQDTDSKIYLESNNPIDLDELIQICKGKWPNVDFASLHVSAEKIHTRCLTYDLHDDADWDNFIVIEKIQ